VDTGSSRKVTARSWIVVAVGVAGLLFQLIQVEDRTPMLLYFTVWSAIVTTVSWPFVDTTSSRVFRIAAQAGAIGNLMSGIVYWAVLFPPNGPGKFLVTILANTTLHAVLPLAVLVRLHARPRPEVLSWLQELATASYPLLYLVTSVLLDLAFGIQSPYGFLQLRGGANVLLNSVGLLVVWCVLAAILHGTTRIGQRGSRHAEAST
jgi:hypothetical protein